jgi:hypothetical protein
MSHYKRKASKRYFRICLKLLKNNSTDDFTNICRRLDEIQKLGDTKFSKKQDAKFKRDGIKPKTPIDSTEDTVVRKTRTRRFRRKTKPENRKYNVVVNLSSKPLISAESSLLSRGLNICPNPPKINVRELDEDLDQFARRLRIKEYFHSKKETSEDLSTDEPDIKEVIDIPRFVKESNWITTPSKNTRLESVIDLIKSDIKHNVDVHVSKTDNLTQAERSALRDIQERNDIIIKPADKGSAVVVMDTTTYLQEAERQLSDCRCYEKLDSDPTLDFTQKIT